VVVIAVFSPIDKQSLPYNDVVVKISC